MPPAGALVLSIAVGSQFSIKFGELCAAQSPFGLMAATCKQDSNQFFSYDSQKMFIKSTNGKCIEARDGALYSSTCQSRRTQEWVFDHSKQWLVLTADPLMCVANGGEKGDRIPVSDKPESCSTVELGEVKETSATPANEEASSNIREVLTAIEEQFTYQGAPNDHDSGLIFGSNCIRKWDAVYRFACMDKDKKRTEFTKELGPVSFGSFQGPKIKVSNTNSNPRPWPGLQWSLCTCQCDSMGFHHLRQYLPRKVAAWLDGGWSLVWCQKPMLDETDRRVAGSRKNQRVRIARARGTILGKIARAPINTHNKESE